MQIINTQPIEKPVRSVSVDDPSQHRLHINSIFYTIQGEGPFAGRTSVFVRLAGCNLQCPMCDTEYTKRTLLTSDEILHRVRTALYGGTLSPSNRQTYYRAKPLVVITGGEPLRQPIAHIIRVLLGNGFAVQIETNGTLFQQLPFEHDDLTIVCSPKAGSINKHLMEHITAFKYVARESELLNSPDGLPTKALDHSNGGGLARPADWWEGTVYLQPADEKDEVVNARNLQAVVDSCLLHGYRLCLQMHKYCNVE
jgi:organic radical activating enzyme